MGFTKGQNRFLRNTNIMLRQKSVLKPAQRKQMTKIAKRVVHNANANKKAIIGESAVAKTQTMLYTDLSLIATGTTEVTRDSGSGDAIYCKTIDIRGMLQINTTGNCIVRIVLFRWMPDVAIDLPTTGDVLDFDNTAVAPFNTLRLQSAQKVKVLKDITIELDSVSNPLRKFHIRKAVNKKVLYNSGDLTGVTGTGHIFLGMVSTLNALSPTATWDANVYFEES